MGCVEISYYVANNQNNSTQQRERSHWPQLLDWCNIGLSTTKKCQIAAAPRQHTASKILHEAL